jgi:1-acyl-sn-glycerol-3-phosphate acyltransferase
MKYSPAGRAASTVILRPLLSGLVRRDWREQHNIPREGGVIIAANHLSEIDPLVLSHYVYKAGRYPVFLAKSTLFESRKVGWILRGCGQIPVYREGTNAGLALRDAEQALREGECLMFYPEGTCTRDPDLWPMTGKTGVARLALATGATVIPVAHWGAHELLRYPTKRFRPLPRKTMHVTSGPPIDLSTYTTAPAAAVPDAAVPDPAAPDPAAPDAAAPDAAAPDAAAPTAETLNAVTAKIMRAIAVLVGELRGERPPDTLFDPRRKAQTS